MPPTGRESTKVPTGATGIGTAGGKGGREALGLRTLCRRNRELQVGKGSIFDPGADPRVDQPPPRRGATPSPRAHSNTSEAPGVDRFASLGGLSPKGECIVEDQSRGRQSSMEGDDGAERPDRGIGGGGQDCPEGVGQVQGGGPEDPCVHGVSG